MPIVGVLLGMQERIQRSFLRLCHRSCTWIGFEDGYSSRQAWISTYLGELGKEYHYQGMDLILEACGLLTQLAVEAHQFAVGRHSFAGDIAGPCLAAEEHAGNGHGIEPTWRGLADLDARETDTFVPDVTNTADSRAARAA